MIICINEDFVLEELQDECVLLNVKTGDYFGLNEVGTDFLKLVDNQKSLEDMIDILLGIYDIDRQTILNDLEGLIQIMVNKNILYFKNA